MDTKETAQLNRLKHYVSGDDASLSLVALARVVAERVAEDFPREAKAREPQETVEQCAERIVRSDVLLCVSSIVSTLAEGYGAVTAQPKRRGIVDGPNELAALCELAMELSAPVDDWEETALQAGWEGPFKDEFGATYFKDKTDGQTWACADWETLCRDHEIEDPYQWEIFEHWAVSNRFADKLEAHGEKVERDFMGLNVWARTTTGQGIAQDSVALKIAADILKA